MSVAAPARKSRSLVVEVLLASSSSFMPWDYDACKPIWCKLTATLVCVIYQLATSDRTISLSWSWTWDHYSSEIFFLRFPYSLFRTTQSISRVKLRNYREGTLDKYEYSSKEQNLILEFVRFSCPNWGSWTYFTRSQNPTIKTWWRVHMWIRFIKFGDRLTVDFILDVRS